MLAFEDQPVIGLFGTCGDTTFREDLFIPEYTRRNINYYNPQVADWKPELAEIEADHLVHDAVQCWPVLGSTYGGGSLAEQGYSIASTLRAQTPFPKFVIVMIEMELSDGLTDKVARKESLRARQLVAAHLAKNSSPNVYVVDSLQEMLETSIILYGVAEQLVALAIARNPAYRQFVRSRQQNQMFADAVARGQLHGDVANSSSQS